MSPEIRWGGEIKIERSPFFYFTVDLKLSPNYFSSTEFDDMARKVNYNPQLMISRLKFLVVSDVIYISGDGPRHLSFWNSLKIKGRLQSAGKISVNHSPSDISYPPRSIYGYSRSLLGILPKEESEKYKITVLEKVLGDFFKTRSA